MTQLFIMLFGVTGVFLSQDTSEHVRAFAPVFGLLAQPFWFRAAYKAKQWGIFVVAIFYTLAWCKGVYVYWIN